MTAEQRLPSAAPMPAAGERKQVLTWAWTAVRPYVGWVLAAAGAIALFVGWFGVSGQSLTAKQIPYLVSAGLTGVALFIMAGVFLATDDIRRQFNRIGELERKVDDLYTLFVADLNAPAGVSEGRASEGRATEPSTAGTVVALPAGSSYHRPTCSLVTGKADVTVVSSRDIDKRGLRPCRVCDPEPAPTQSR
jgi:hypothetical protein